MSKKNIEKHYTVTDTEDGRIDVEGPFDTIKEAIEYAASSCPNYEMKYVHEVVSRPIRSVTTEISTIVKVIK